MGTNEIMRVSAIINEGQKIKVDISQVTVPPYHDRTDVDDDNIESLANNMSEVGQLNPILLDKKSDTHFELISGLRRYEAALKLNWSEIDAIPAQRGGSIPVSKRGSAIVSPWVVRRVSAPGVRRGSGQVWTRAFFSARTSIVAAGTGSASTWKKGPPTAPRRDRASNSPKSCSATSRSTTAASAAAGCFAKRG